MANVQQPVGIVDMNWARERTLLCKANERACKVHLSSGCSGPGLFIIKARQH